MKIKGNLSNDCFENNLLGLLVYPRLNCSLNTAFDLSTYIVNTMPHGKSFVYGLETTRGVAECSVENFEFIVLPASACICK